jgi:hypothetical protein
MLRWLLAAFLIAHGFVHITVWANQKATTAQGTTPDHSWLLGDQHSIVIALTYATVALFAVAGGALILHMEAWRIITVVAAGISLLLVALFPEAILNGWIVAPVAIDLSLIAGLLWLEWPSRTMVGV